MATGMVWEKLAWKARRQVCVCGVKCGNKGLNVGATAEVVRRVGPRPLVLYGTAVYGSVGLNANTVVKLGTEGIQVSLE